MTAFERVWDVFRAKDGPAYGEYTRRMSDRLLTTAEVVARLKGAGL